MAMAVTYREHKQVQLLCHSPRERARYIERETTYSGLQEHRNTNESTERALEH
jgi:hypothetical protein